MRTLRDGLDVLVHLIRPVRQHVRLLRELLELREQLLHRTHRSVAEAVCLAACSRDVRNISACKRISYIPLDMQNISGTLLLERLLAVARGTDDERGRDAFEPSTRQ